jgi:hypothetical protein
MRYELLSYKLPKSRTGDYEITVIKSPNFWERLFGHKERELTFVGACTVWYVKHGDKLYRCNISTEYALCNVWKTIEYKNKV